MMQLRVMDHILRIKNPSASVITITTDWDNALSLKEVLEGRRAKVRGGII